MNKELLAVDLDKLSIRPGDQRKVSLGRVYRIAKEFRPSSCQPLDVELVDGTYWIIDGQHRFLAAKRSARDIRTLPCWVINNGRPLTAAEKSQHVLDVQKNRGGLGARDEFIRLAETDEEFTKAKQILIHRGLWGKIKCLGSVRNVTRRYCAHRVKETLDFIDSAWPAEGIVSYQGWVIAGVAKFLAHLYQVVGHDSAAFEKLAEAAAQRIGARAALSSVPRRAQEMTGRVTAMGALPIARALVDIYNTKLRVNRLPMP